MADKNETFYYELDVFSQTDWSDHEHFAFTGPTYEAVMEKARKYNVDVTDLDRWNTTLYVTGDSTADGGSGIVASCSLITCYNRKLTDKVAWGGEWSIDEDPIPSVVAAEAANVADGKD